MYIVIDKPLKLIGEDQTNTIIKGFQQNRGNIPIIDVLANDVTISGFTLTGGVFCIRADPVPFNCHIIGNTLTNSTDDAIRAYGGISDLTFDVTPSNLVISNNIISDNQGRAMYLDCGYVTISENIIANNGHRQNPYPSDAIGLDGASNITIANNTITNNGKSGIHLGWWGPYQVYENTITNNGAAGIEFATYCTNTTIYGNNLVDNAIGIQLSDVPEGYRGGRNVVWNNNIKGNQQQATAGSFTDFVSWDNGEKGNFWSDYKTKYPQASEIGSSGTGNVPYAIDNNNTDNHPLMAEVTSFSAPPPPLATSVPLSTSATTLQPQFPSEAAAPRSPPILEFAVLVVLVLSAIVLSINIAFLISKRHKLPPLEKYDKKQKADVS
jgi:hypothetical protein